VLCKEEETMRMIGKYFAGTGDLDCGACSFRKNFAANLWDEL
jgi:hypothetical protein